MRLERRGIRKEKLVGCIEIQIRRFGMGLRYFESTNIVMKTRVEKYFSGKCIQRELDQAETGETHLSFPSMSEL